jgi:hypothetical protein
MASLCPGISGIHLLGDRQGAVNLDAEIAHGTLVALAKKDSLRAGTFAGLQPSNRSLRPVGPVPRTSPVAGL